MGYVKGRCSVQNIHTVSCTYVYKQIIMCIVYTGTAIYVMSYILVPLHKVPWTKQQHLSIIRCTKYTTWFHNYTYI